MVTFATTPPRRSKLRDLLEDHGFDMNALPEAARHQLLKPVGFRSYGLRDTQPDERGIRHGPDIVEGEDYFSWKGLEVVEAEPADTRQCLWDFIRCAERPPREVLEFVQRWGILVDPPREDGAGAASVAEFWEEACDLRSVLITLVATEAGELVDEETLVSVASQAPYFESGQPADAEEVVRRLGLDPIADTEYNIPDHIAYPHFEQIRLERWRGLRSAGRGLDLQARLVAAVLNIGPSSYPGSFIWDERGRRFERVATGARPICWSHLAALFSSSVIDVFLCAICGRPFEYEKEAYKRRPRRGKRRFCSVACRLEAKKESNRESWRRNAARWRPSKAKGDGKAS